MKQFFASALERFVGRKVELPAGVSLRTLLQHYGSKATMPLLRGLWHRLFLKRAGWPLFVGKDVTLRFAHMLECGRSVNIGDRVRIDALSSGGIQLGHRVSIRDGGILQLSSHLNNLGEHIHIDDDVFIGPYAFIGAAAPVHIGARTLIGPRLVLIAEEHAFHGKASVFEQGVHRAGIEIGEDCWIGACVTILDGVRIGRGCVIGAGTLVTRSIPDDAVSFGVPARVQRMREADSPLDKEPSPDDAQPRRHPQKQTGAG
jgi:acetyltransferase-like isoleucine patch superfamily enzyme